MNRKNKGDIRQAKQGQFSLEKCQSMTKMAEKIGESRHSEDRKCKRHCYNTIYSSSFTFFKYHSSENFFHSMQYETKFPNYLVGPLPPSRHSKCFRSSQEQTHPQPRTDFSRTGNTSIHVVSRLYMGTNHLF
jgi:hypothetical protein